MLVLASLMALTLSSCVHLAHLSLSLVCFFCVLQRVHLRVHSQAAVPVHRRHRQRHRLVPQLHLALHQQQ